MPGDHRAQLPDGGFALSGLRDGAPCSNAI